MRKKIIFIALFFTVTYANAQFQYSKLIGNNSSDFSDGYGGYLKLNFPISEADNLSLEGGGIYFQSKKDNRYAWVVIPIKAGYLHTFNKMGYGIYIEPQAGYTVYGITVEDNIFRGLVLGFGTGYLFKDGGGFMNYDLGLRYETAFYPGGSLHYLSLRFTKAFLLKKRNK